MTAVELTRIASAIPVPVDAQFGRARAYVQVVAGRHQAYFGLEGGIRRSPGVGPMFERPRDAIRLVDLLNGETSRRAPQPDLAHASGEAVESRDMVAAPAEAPVLGAGASLSCAGCGGPLPSARRGQRRLTCSAACRERFRYRRAALAAGADTDSASPNLTPSRPAAG